jgi:hypothetical protein
MIDVAVATLVKTYAGSALGDRVALSTVPDKVTVNLPKLKFTPLGGPRDHTNSGPMRLVKARFQFDLFHTSAVTARTLLNTIRAGLESFKGVSNGVTIARIYSDELPTLSLAGVKTEAANETVIRLTQDFLIDFYE